ncbi:hypothetical protein N7466_000407 [Penicillium verhagenii]|uniref:uncharacterized protein n=1 Tax=Penicillium verhagenii TaxID=1562060 RepID=UPI002544F762|nr:uncharacterized protein N7466_000407 [Penicillium verhagenii]KAJ5947392.1 hypothetical protein N7466_000407 [Penicillium verhagenii]
MTHSSHYRNLSPSGGRQHVVGPRASTGTVQLGSSTDPYDPPRHYYDHDGYPSDAGYAGSSYRQYPIRHAALEVRPVATHKSRDSGHSTKRTEYTIEPQTRHRSRSNTVSAIDIQHSSPRLSVPSYHHSAHSIHGRDHSPMKLTSDHNGPAHHGRQHRRFLSTDYASDTGYLEPRDSSRRSSSRHRSHRDHPPSGRRQYPPYYGIKHGDDIEKYDAYSYTTPREQFDRDYPVQSRHPAGRRSLDRPLSMTGMEDDHHQWVPRRERPRGPPTSRGMDKLDREGRSRTTYDEDHHRDVSKSRGHDRSLVAVPHLSDDDHDSFSDSHRRRRHRSSHHESDRHNRDDRSPRHHNEDKEKALVGLGTAALGGGHVDLSDYEYHGSQEPRRPRETERDYKYPQSTSRELVQDAPSPERKKLYLEPAEHHERRRSRSRRRAHPRRSQGDESDWPSEDEDLRKYQREPSAAPRRQHSSEDTSEDNRPTRGHRRPRERSHVRSRSRSLSDDSKDGGKKVVAVDPPVQKEPDGINMPKGILKKPRPAFPEEPNPVREGVAPLSKDADKHGIPPGARWTKIDRRLVSPSALKHENIRFEERDDYVIVLKVLSKEDIQNLALATELIRAARHKENVRDKRQHRAENQRDGYHGDSTSSDDEDEHNEPLKPEAPPKIEAKSQHLSLPERPRASSHSVH